jgi:ribosome recycling factor
VKTIKQMAEEARVRIRSHRRDGMDSAKKTQKSGDITEDELRTVEKEIQELTDKSVKRIDEAVATKEAEIMRV